MPKRTPKLTLGSLKPSPKNPRKIDPQNQRGLAESLREFGDLSGIVFNKRDGTLISGHQRVELLKKSFGDELPIVDGFIQLPDDAGKVRVREVDWDDVKATAAMIAANNHAIQGSFTASVYDLIEVVEDARPDLSDKLALRMVEVDGKADEGGGAGGGSGSGSSGDGGEVPGMALGPFEHYDYVIVLAKSTSDWLQLVDALDLEQVDSSPIAGKKKIGLGRAVFADKLLDLLDTKLLEVATEEVTDGED